MMKLEKVEKQLILYSKGHFKRINYTEDLKYFAAELYGLGIEQVDQYNILHMVIDLYEQLVEGGYINFRLKYFLSNTFKRGWNDNNTKQIEWNHIISQMMAEIQGIPVKGLELGEADLSIIESR